MELRGTWLSEGPKYAFLLFVCFFVFFPLYLMVNISLKNSAQIAKNPWAPSATVEIIKIEAPHDGMLTYEPAAITLTGLAGTQTYRVPFDPAWVVEWPRDKNSREFSAVQQGRIVATLLLAEDIRLRADSHGRWSDETGRAIGMPEGFTVGLTVPAALTKFKGGTEVAQLIASGDAQIQRTGAAYTFTGKDGLPAKLVTRYRQAIDQIPAQANVLVLSGASVTGGQLVCTYKKRILFKWENYIEAYHYVLPYVLNTVIIAVSVVVFSLLFASLSAYAFARYNFWGKSVLFGMIIVLMMIPSVLNLIPMFVIVKSFPFFGGNNLFGQGGHGLLDNLLVVILPAVAGSQIINIYILRNFFEGISEGLFESGRIDGASDMQMYWHICLPLSKPILGTLAIMTIVGEWNNYIWPLVTLKKQSLMTITIGLAHLEGQFTSDYGLQMAGFTLAAIPLVILFMCTMKLFIKGISSGAIKF
jgi:ABC-type glycerol-3-phosphate transport system permease component